MRVSHEQEPFRDIGVVAIFRLMCGMTKNKLQSVLTSHPMAARRGGLFPTAGSYGRANPIENRYREESEPGRL